MSALWGHSRAARAALRIGFECLQFGLMHLSGYFQVYEFLLAGRVVALDRAFPTRSTSPILGVDAHACATRRLNVHVQWDCVVSCMSSDYNSSVSPLALATSAN